MTDPSSVIASGVKLLSICVQASESLLKFYAAFNDKGSEVGQVMGELKELLSDIRTVLHIVRSGRFQSTEHDVGQAFGRPIGQCEGMIVELRDENEKIIGLSANSARNTLHVPVRQTTYPFRPSTLLRLEEDIIDIRYHMSSVLQALRCEGQKTAHDDPSRLNSLTGRISASHLSSTIRDWLDAPDAVVDHITIYAKHQIQSGMWFTMGPCFTDWLTRKNSFLWLNGRAGSGKSVLCSTAIHYTFHITKCETDIGFGFFYLKFDELPKQDESAMVRALLLQLAGQCQDCQTDLTRLHASCKPNPPSTERSLEYLRQMICRFRSVYLFFDALDESRRNEKRESVLAVVRRMREWGLPGLHLLVTSRDEPDIRENLNPSSNEEVGIESSGIKGDISDFLSFKLNTHTSLRKWKTHHDHIQQVLSDRAQGVFRYIECQFDVLTRCPRTKKHLYKCLQSLPRDLDETYERVLSSIDGYACDARRILTLLCFSLRPLTVAELADAYAVDLDRLHFNPEDRLLDIDSVKEICQGLVEISVKEDERSEGQVNPIARISHFSVQEYLESDRILPQSESSFSLQSESGHALLSQVCLIYLLEMATCEMKRDEATTDFPLAHYAAESWYSHYEKAASMRSRLDTLVLELFKNTEGSFKKWIKICDLDKNAGDTGHGNPFSSGAPTPVYLASFLGLYWLVEYLLSDDREEDTRKKSLVNEQCGYLGNALQAASYNGHKEVVKALLDKGADANSQGGRFGNALQAASYNGHENVVQLLLDHGIDINIQGGEFGYALLAASYNGHTGVLRILLSHGANTNVHLERIGNALQVASWRGYPDLVQILLDSGVSSVNIPGGEYGNALQAASYNGHQKVVQILLDAGAKTNIQGGRFGYPLQAASVIGQEEIVMMLLEKDADVNAVGGRIGTALQAASLGGYENIVQILLERRADTNIQHGLLGNALQAASWRGHRNVVQMLLENGVRVNTLGGQYGSALQAASLRGHIDVVQILLDNGADPNTLGGEYGNALVAASYTGHEKIVQLLLYRGADVNAQVDCGIAGNALEAATLRGQETVMQLLIDAGAET